MIDHGYSRYAYGCRCNVCRSAKSAYMRSRRAEAAAKRRAAVASGSVFVADGIYHGTASGYRDSSCRCTECRRAWKRDAVRWQRDRGTRLNAEKGAA